ncbi:MAG: helix-turn-helix transcriptional regulator [Candidatus Heteroscillospira sp.]|jgi:predicted transcriptional regulator YheO
MKDSEILELFRELLDFLEEIMGPECEIVLQDLREPMKILDIRNPIDKTRVPGGPVSDFARLVMSEADKYNGIKFVTNYKGRNTGDYAEISTSTYIIRNARERIIGMLCINSSLEPAIKLHAMLDSYLRRKSRINIGDDTYSGDVLVDVGKIVSDGMSHLIGDPAELSLEAKKQLVGSLSDRGIFLVRGAVNEVAKRLDVSEQTVYRYMKESQK